MSENLTSKDQPTLLGEELIAENLTEIKRQEDAEKRSLMARVIFSTALIILAITGAWFLYKDRNQTTQTTQEPTGTIDQVTIAPDAPPVAVVEGENPASVTATPQAPDDTVSITPENATVDANAPGIAPTPLNPRIGTADSITLAPTPPTPPAVIPIAETKSTNVGFKIVAPSNWQLQERLVGESSATIYDSLGSGKIYGTVEVYSDSFNDLNAVREQLLLANNVQNLRTITVNGRNYLEYSILGQAGQRYATVAQNKIYYVTDFEKGKLINNFFPI